MRWKLLFTSLLVLSLNGLATQLTPRQYHSYSSNPDDQQQYSLEGAVVNAITGEPLARTLVQVGGITQQSMLTGTDGRFKFTGLAHGVVMVSSSKPGFFDEPLNAKAGGGRRAVFYGGHGGAGNTVEVGPDTAPITIRLVPEAVITGTVQDADRDPIESASVMVWQSVILDGRKQWQQMGSGGTNEDGHFRIANLLPGRYYVAVQPPRTSLDTDDKAQKNKLGYPLMIYYPASPDRTSAAPVEVGPGQRLDLEFDVKSEPVFKISGQVFPQTPNVSLRCVALDEEDFAGVYMQYQPSGKFEMQNVPAGRYHLIAEGEMHSELLLNVAGNMTDVYVQLQPPISIPVMVKTEFKTELTSATPQASDAKSGAFNNPLVSVTLRGADSERPNRLRGLERAEDGSFILKNVIPGTYFLEIMPIIGGYVQSARCGSTDLLREPLLVPVGGHLPPIEVVLRDDGGSVNLKVTSAAPNSQNMVVIVSDSAPAHPPQLRYVFGNAESQLGPLGPGEYRVFAFDSIEGVEYRNPDVLEKYASRALRISVAANSKTNAAVELIHAGE